MLLPEMTWPEIGNLSRDIPVVVPVAALEQHGHHMPVFTDSLLVGEVVRRVGAAMADRVLIAPLMWLGNSHHHMDFPGTLSASPRVYLDLLNDLAESLIAHGFRRIVFINGHGGNISRASRPSSRSGSGTATGAICCCCSRPTGTTRTRTPAVPTWCSRRWGTPASGRRR
jgi:creatinine amidohydrolase